MVTSENGIQFLKELEGFENRAYPDIAGVWTIGYGTTDGVEEGDVITEAGATRLLRERVERIEAFINKNITAPLKQNQFDALVSFLYNVGETAFKGSKTMQAINRELDTVPYLLKRWRFITDRKSGAKLEATGLLNRRNKEAALWLNEHILGVHPKPNT